jgi:N-acetylglucosamine kinase-like BadF-type ATPase
MPEACFLRIDNGGTLTKAVLSDSQETKIAGASRKVPAKGLHLRGRDTPAYHGIVSTMDRAAILRQSHVLLV